MRTHWLEGETLRLVRGLGWMPYKFEEICLECIGCFGPCCTCQAQSLRYEQSMELHGRLVNPFLPDQAAEDELTYQREIALR